MFLSAGKLFIFFKCWLLYITLWCRNRVAIAQETESKMSFFFSGNSSAPRLEPRFQDVSFEYKLASTTALHVPPRRHALLHFYAPKLQNENTENGLSVYFSTAKMMFSNSFLNEHMYIFFAQEYTSSSLPLFKMKMFLY